MDGKANGRGKCIEKKSLGGEVDGDVYDGECKDDYKNGQGKYTFVSGNVYDGGWKDDKRNGRGDRKSTRLNSSHG